MPERPLWLAPLSSLRLIRRTITLLVTPPIGGRACKMDLVCRGLAREH